MLSKDGFTPLGRWPTAWEAQGRNTGEHPEVSLPTLAPRTTHGWGAWHQWILAPSQIHFHPQELLSRPSFQSQARQSLPMNGPWSPNSELLLPSLQVLELELGGESHYFQIQVKKVKFKICIVFNNFGKIKMLIKPSSERSGVKKSLFLPSSHYSDAIPRRWVISFPSCKSQNFENIKYIFFLLLTNES